MFKASYSSGNFSDEERAILIIIHNEIKLKGKICKSIDFKLQF